MGREGGRAIKGVWNAGIDDQFHTDPWGSRRRDCIRERGDRVASLQTDEGMRLWRVVSELVGAFGPSRLVWLVRALTLASAVALMFPCAWGHSATMVEYGHLPSGLAAWQRHSLGIYRVCGPLSKLLYSLPVYLAGVRVDYPASFDADTQGRWEWQVGFLFQNQYPNRFLTIFRWSRILPCLVTMLGGCLVCELATRLFGVWPGIASLCVWCWTPMILGHGPLITSDVISAVMLLLAARTFWAFLLGPGPRTTILAGMALGAALATKFTLLILYPCWAFVLIGRALQVRVPKPTGGPGARGSVSA